MSTDSVLPTRGDTCVHGVQNTRCPLASVEGYYGFIFDSSLTAVDEDEDSLLAPEFDLPEWRLSGSEMIPDIEIGGGVAHSVLQASLVQSLAEPQSPYEEIQSSVEDHDLLPVFDILALAFESVLVESATAPDINTSDISEYGNQSVGSVDIPNAVEIGGVRSLTEN